MPTLRFAFTMLAPVCAIVLAACGSDTPASDPGAPNASPTAVADASTTSVAPAVAADSGAQSSSSSSSTVGASDAGPSSQSVSNPSATANASSSTPATSDAGNAQPSATSADAGSAAYVWPSDCEKHYTFLAHNNNGANDTSKKQVAPGSQYYASYYFRAPWGSSEVQGLKFRSIVDNKRILHHWILYGVNSGTEQDGAVQGGQGQPIGSMQGEFYIAGWAPGALDIAMPDGVGLHLPTGTSAMFRLEIHYYNTNAGATTEEDASGVEFCTTSHKRAAEAAIHWMGTTNVSVPANGKATIKSTCKPQITNGPVHLISLSSHMHKTGVHSTAVLKRANGGAAVTLIDDPFSFMEQAGFTEPRDGSAPDVLINAGDTIDVSCSYDNQTAQAKRFGSNTEDEMCFFYAMAWPRGQLRNGSASIVPGAEPEVNCIQ